MQAIAVFAAVFAVASAHVVSVPSTHVQSQRLGGSFAYSSTEGQSLGVVSPAATTYSLSGLPVSTVGGVQYSTLPAATVSGVQYTSVPAATVSGVQYTSVPAAAVSGVQYSSVPVSTLSGVPVVANTNTLGNVAVVKTTDLSGVQNVVVPSTTLVQAGTPAATYKPVSGVSTISGWPVSSYVI